GARAILRTLSLSVAVWFMEGTVFLSVALALRMAVNGAMPFLSLSMSTLSTLLPSSPGYIGTFDYFAMQSLMLFDMPAQQAVAFAIIVHLMIWIPPTAVGLGFLLYRSIQPSAAAEATHNG